MHMTIPDFIVLVKTMKLMMTMVPLKMARMMKLMMTMVPLKMARMMKLMMTMVPLKMARMMKLMMTMVPLKMARMMNSYRIMMIEIKTALRMEKIIVLIYLIPTRVIQMETN